MKFQRKLEHLGCANCAQKMEEALEKLSYVNKVKVNFLMSKLTMESESELSEEQWREIQEIIHSIEPYCNLSVK